MTVHYCIICQHRIEYIATLRLWTCRCDNCPCEDDPDSCEPDEIFRGGIAL